MHRSLRCILVAAATAAVAFAALPGALWNVYAAEKTVYVGPQRIDCEGMGPQKCYQVKERPEDPWLLFYDEIEGFDYEEGYTYEVRVEETRVADPPADAASFKWRLLEVVNKTPEGNSQGDSLPQEITSTEWLLATYQIARAIPRDVSSFRSTLKLSAEGRANGSGGCNTFTAGYETGANHSITFDSVASTRKACAGEIMEWESTYFQALESARAYTLEDNRLRITFANGQGTLTYAPIDGTGDIPDDKPGEGTGPVVPGMPATGGGIALFLLLSLCGMLVLSGALLRKPKKQRHSSE